MLAVPTLVFMHWITILVHGKWDLCTDRGDEREEKPQRGEGGLKVAGVLAGVVVCYGWIGLRKLGSVWYGIEIFIVRGI